MLKHLLVGSALVIAAVAPASAATLFDLGASTGETASPGNYTYNFNAGAGAGSLAFQVQGYRTIDGSNCCTDVLTVALNGTILLQGAYNLGGGGADLTFLISPDGVVTVNNGARTVDFTSSLTLLNGANTLSFDYSGTAQGLGDEAWGINSATVTGNAFVGGGVPEPSAWALMILGFGAVGGALRGSRKQRANLTYT